MKRVMQRGLEMPYSNKFVDDPRAEESDSNGTYVSNYTYSKYVCVGVPMTLEQAQEMHRRDINKQNTWGKDRKYAVSQ